VSFLYRQDVVYVVTGRYSRSAKFATSSELLYVVQLLPSECCDEYNTYTTLSEEFRVVFRFTHTSTFELIPSCLGFPGALVTLYIGHHLYLLIISDSYFPFLHIGQIRSPLTLHLIRLSAIYTSSCILLLNHINTQYSLITYLSLLLFWLTAQFRQVPAIHWPPFVPSDHLRFLLSISSHWPNQITPNTPLDQISCYIHQQLHSILFNPSK